MSRWYLRIMLKDQHLTSDEETEIWHLIIYSCYTPFDWLMWCAPFYSVLKDNMKNKEFTQ